MSITGTNNISNTITERKGVCEVEKRCCLINWVFRERGHSDFGVDADIEEAIIEDGVPRLTNRHIAVQIKCGASNVGYDEKEKLFYYDIPSNRLANYWLGADRPVVIMYYDMPKEGEIAKADDDGLVGTVYWAQIKQANFCQIKNRKSKKKRKDNKKPQHKVARIYLKDKFTKDSGPDFSNIISTYLPTYYSDLRSPSIVCGNQWDITIQQLTNMMQEMTDLLDEVLASTGFNEEDQPDVDALFQNIERLRLNLFYNKNIVNLLLSRYADMVFQTKNIYELCFDEFNEFANKGVQKVIDNLEQASRCLAVIKNDCEVLSVATEDVEGYNSLVNQTISTIVDYTNMLDTNISNIKSFVSLR